MNVESGFSTVLLTFILYKPNTPIIECAIIKNTNKPFNPNHSMKIAHKIGPLIAISGPILCAIFMEWFGLNGLFVFLIIAHSIIGVFGLYRMKVRSTVENPDSTFTPIPATITPAGLELDPDAPATLDQTQVNETVKT